MDHYPYYALTVCLILVVLLTKYGEAIGDVFIAQRNSNSVCVTNGTGALIWIQPNIVGSTSAVSRFFPETSYSFRCDIGGENPECDVYWVKEPWKIENSLQGTIGEVVLDRRWETFKEHFTEYATGNNQLKYHLVAKVAKDNFEIPLSIRISQEAHIFLCDGQYPSSSNCYWLMLQAWNNNKTALRRCTQGQIPMKLLVYPKQPPCSELLVEKNHPVDCPLFMSENEWQNFKLSKKGDTLIFSSASPQENGEDIINYTGDHESFYGLKYLFIHSKDTNGLWKIHDYNYIFTKETQMAVQLGSAIYVDNIKKKVCISMFITMCSTCKLKLQLINNQRQRVDETTYEVESAGWTKIDHISRELTDTRVSLYVSTISESANPEQFWAIDNVRLCQEGEHRSIVKYTETSTWTCQDLSGQSKLLHFNKKIDVSENSCQLGTVSRMCVPCSRLFLGSNTCDQTKICEIEDSGRLICSCSPGFQGSECTKECLQGTFGAGCKNSCGECNTEECNTVDGKCTKTYYYYGCNDDFTGDRCDIPPGAIFKKPPKIQEVSFTNCTLQVVNFEIDSRYSTGFRGFRIQYKKSKDVSAKWFAYQLVRALGDSSLITITGLEPDTSYVARAVILDYNSEYTYNGSYVKSVTFKTKCIVASYKVKSTKSILIKTAVTKQDIDITPTNNSISIRFIIKETSCKLDDCNLNLTPWGKKGFNNLTVTVFTDLKPFTNYEIQASSCGSIQHFRKVVKTSEGRPGKITKLTFSNVSSTNFYIEWDEPKTKNGIIQYYVVRYKHNPLGQGCQKVFTDNEKIVSSKTIKLENLLPYSQYAVTIFAFTTVEGEPTTQSQTTLQSDYLAAEEIPQVVEVDSRSFTAVITLSQIKCEVLRGPLFIYIIATCVSNWCSGKIVNFARKYAESIEIRDLVPFSEYELTVDACRTQIESCNENRKIQKFMTKPAIPNQVTDLLVVSKGEDYISVRWKAPYQTNGILKEYKVLYYSYYQTRSGANSLVVNVTTSSCQLWPEFHCAEINHLISQSLYTIEILARNVDPPDYNTQGKSITTITKTEAPQPPYDLEIIWKEDNTLELSWKHPNISNGHLMSFIIEVMETDGKVIMHNSFSITEEQYKLIYNYQITEPLASSTSYMFSVRSDNGQLSAEAETRRDTSPPPAPSIHGDLHLTSSNDSISVKMSIAGASRPVDNTWIFVLISSEKLNKEQKIPEILKGISDVDVSRFRVVYESSDIPKSSETSNKSVKVTIRSNEGEVNLTNPLEPGTEYTISVVLINVFNNKSRRTVYKRTESTLGERLEKSNRTHLLWLLLLLLLIPMAFFVFKERVERGARMTDLKTRITPDRRSLRLEEESFALEKPLHSVQAEIPELPVKKNKENLVQEYAKPVQIMEFAQYVKESIRNGELQRQHALFPRGQTKPWEYAALTENKVKNRYNNLLAYDHTRVVLEKKLGNNYSDYINANYIDGYKIPQAYIATQGPKAATLGDFWRMIWQENVENIVMLANVYENRKKKVEKYWPDINQNLLVEDITIQHVSNSIFADYELREFNVCRNGANRKVHQLHFTTWPDHGIPLYCQSLVPFLQNLLKIALKPKSPVVVHCSAGVGRTGTVILCDICLRMAAREGVIDVLGTFKKLRDQRANMVDNIEQYKLAHLVILECLVGMQTAISCSEIEKSVQNLQNNNGIKLQLRYLKDTAWQNEAMKSGVIKKQLAVYHEKNRFRDITPEDQGRVFLKPYPGDDEASSYINAVVVDGFRSPGRFIVTQQPLPNTVGDFWRLVDENSISVIISLNEIDSCDKTCCKFWPNQDNFELHPVDFITLRHSNTRSLECYDLITIHVYLKGSQEYYSVEIISMKNWRPKSNVPNSVEEFLTLLDESEGLCRRSEKVIVTCYDGVKACGIYVAMAFVIEKIKLEQTCDICQAVRIVRHNRHQFIEEEVQFRFLYEAAVKYIHGFQSYANFN